MLRYVPNILTIGRFFLTVLFVFMLLYSPKVSAQRYSLFMDLAFVLFVIAGLTDLMDGPIARKLGVASKFGRMLDPLADKVLVCGTFVCFALIGQPKLFDFSRSTLLLIHWAFAGMIILREVYVTVLRHIAEAKGVNFAAMFSGKLKMFLQSFAIGTVLVKMAHVPEATWGSWFTTVVYILTLAITVVSGIQATRRPAWQQVAKEYSHT